MTLRRTWRQRNPEGFRKAWRRWYEANAQRKVAWQARRRQKLREWLRTLKASKGCQRCGERALECLHFHHRDPSEKELTVADVITRGWSKKRILAEITKCDVLCANCHAKHHWDERLPL